MLNLRLIAAALVIAFPASAQQRDSLKMRRAEPPYPKVWINGQDVSPRVEPFMQRRARLGISVNLEAKETDSLGAFVQAVTPGGPGAKAGIRSGDIIIKLDGKSVLTDGTRKTDQEESAPGVHLIELAAKLEPNDTVSVEFLRGDARRTVKLITGDEPLMADFEGNGFLFRTQDDGEHGEPLRVPGMRVEPDPGARIFTFEGRPLAGMKMRRGMDDFEVAPLNADLGYYFGTTEGVLVLRVPANSSLNLKSGDVILSVDGRKPANPGSLMRILGSYDEGESIKLEILRQKQKMTVTGKVDHEE